MHTHTIVIVPVFNGLVYSIHLTPLSTLPATSVMSCDPPPSLIIVSGHTPSPPLHLYRNKMSYNQIPVHPIIISYLLSISEVIVNCSGSIIVNPCHHHISSDHICICVATTDAKCHVLVYKEAHSTVCTHKPALLALSILKQFQLLLG